MDKSFIKVSPLKGFFINANEIIYGTPPPTSPPQGRRVKVGVKEGEPCTTFSYAEMRNWNIASM